YPFFFFSSRRRHTRFSRDWSSDVCSSDLEALREAIAARLQIRDADLLDFTVFKRSYDARKKNSVITFIYVIDLEARDEAALLDRFDDDRNVRPAPDTNYHVVAHAPVGLKERPIVVG